MNLKMIFFDLEGVLVQGKNIWVRMHEKFNTLDKDKLYLDQFFSNKFGYSKWASKVVNLWKGGDIKILYDLIEDIVYSEGINELFAYLKKKDVKSYILSTAIDQLVKKVANDLKINRYLATKICEDQGKITGDIKIGCSFYTKGEVLSKIAKEENVDLKNIMAIGDAINDLSMFKKADISIAFNSKCSRLKKIATHIVNSNNLLDVLEIIKTYV